MMVLSRRLLSESYLDAALHDVLLHLLSQIPDHMPCTDSFLVLLPSAQNMYSRICNIHISQQFSMRYGVVSLFGPDYYFITQCKQSKNSYHEKMMMMLPLPLSLTLPNFDLYQLSSFFFNSLFSSVRSFILLVSVDTLSFAASCSRLNSLFSAKSTS
jgi:hypothetical protein